jgi:hypothetical protein
MYPTQPGRDDSQPGDPVLDANGKQQVLIELRAPRVRGAVDAVQLGAALSVPGLQVDPSFDPVPMPVTSEPGSRTLGRADQDTVIVRASIDPSQIPDVEQHPFASDISDHQGYQAHVDALRAEATGAGRWVWLAIDPSRLRPAGHLWLLYRFVLPNLRKPVTVRVYNVEHAQTYEPDLELGAMLRLIRAVQRFTPGTLTRSLRVQHESSRCTSGLV